MNKMKRFKFSKVNGEKYLQIWDKDKFMKSCGTAESLYNKLVKYDKLVAQTKVFAKIQTKIQEEMLSDED